MTIHEFRQGFIESSVMEIARHSSINLEHLKKLLREQAAWLEELLN